MLLRLPRESVGTFSFRKFTPGTSPHLTQDLGAHFAKQLACGVPLRLNIYHPDRHNALPLGCFGLVISAICEIASLGRWASSGWCGLCRGS